MEHIRQFDWCYSEHENHFVKENDLDNCVIERILCNKFRDPLVSSESEDEKPTFNWNEILAKQKTENAQHRVFVPGFRNLPPYPKLSSLTKSQHIQCLKVLCAKNPNILPRGSMATPKNYDYKVFEEVQKAYLDEQKEFVAWAKTLWTTNHCIRALRPKPLVETTYEAEFAMKAKEMESFPKNYIMAAQIPLESRNDRYEMIHEKDLISVDINSLPKISNPEPITKKFTILIPRAVPEPCTKHPCRIILPHESSSTMLPLTEVHNALAQFAAEHGAECVADEHALACLLETDRQWNLCLSVSEVVTLDGGSRSVLVVGSEFCAQRECAQLRTLRAFRHLLEYALIPEEEKSKLHYTNKESTASRESGAVADLAPDQDDSSDDECLVIVADDMQAHDNTDTEDDVVLSELARSPSKPPATAPGRAAASVHAGHAHHAGHDGHDEYYKCTCEGTIFERPPPRSYARWRLHNVNSQRGFSLLVHCDHKLKGEAGEVIVEPIPEYQLELGASAVSPHRTRSLMFSLMMRKNATLMKVRVDGQSGEVVRVDSTTLEEMQAEDAVAAEAAGEVVGCALEQLQGLRPGHYLLRHEPSHGMNALLYSPRAGGGAGGGAEGGAEGVQLGFSCEPRADTDDAHAVRTPPTLVPLLLPLHKYRKMLPCAFTPHEMQVAKETKKPAAKQKAPPQAITLGAQPEGVGNTKWPKKKSKGKKTKRKS